MVSQGFWGALEQYWTVEPKVRLDRKNTWFEDHEPSHSDLIIGMYVTIIVTLFLIVSAMVSVVL